MTFGIGDALASLDWVKRGYDAFVLSGSAFSREDFVQVYAETVRQAIDLVPSIDALPEARLDVATVRGSSASQDSGDKKTDRR
jgi:hypothetical protein